MQYLHTRVRAWCLSRGAVLVRQSAACRCACAGAGFTGGGEWRKDVVQNDARVFVQRHPFCFA